MCAGYPRTYAPRFTVTVGGKKFPEYDYISNVIVDTTIDGADYFALTLTYPFDHEQVSFVDLDWKTFDPGKTVSIKMGYGEGSDANTEVFRGTIESVRTEFPEQEPPSVVISGYSSLRKMMKGTNSKSWEKKTLGNIVRDVASKYFKRLKVEKANLKLDRAVQDNESDYQFVQNLASTYGFEFFSSLGDGYFRPQTGGSSPERPVAELYYGESLESFSAEMTAPSHGEVEVRYWNENKKKPITGSAKNDAGSGKEVFTVPVSSRSEAKEIAESKLSSREVTGVAETFGIPSILAGKVVKLSGVGKKFTNSYYVTDAKHRIGESGYRMTIKVRML